MNNSTINISKHLIPEKDKTIYLAISGGVDSMVLLHLLSQLSNPIHLLHVNYHLRGEDSNADETIIREQALNYGAEVTVLNFDMKKHLKEKGGNLQNEARKIRYSFFDKHVGDFGILMTAHHFDDQMETFFMHLSRKSGIAGMSCMAMKNGNHLRPLLNFRKQDLYDFARENTIPFREDKSNSENKYLRNLWRNKWIPKLESDIPTLPESIGILIDSFQAERANLEGKYAAEIAEVKTSKTWTFSSFDLMSEDGKHILAKEFGIRPTELLELNQLRKADKSKRLEIQRLDLTIWNSGSQFSFEYDVKSTLPKLVVRSVDSMPTSFTKDIVYLDSLKINGELKIRNWQNGDRIAPAGMQGSQLVSDIIKDAGVESQYKSNVMVVEDDERVVWIIGLKVGREVLADVETKGIISVSINRD